MTDPDEIIDTAASLVAGECRSLCKRYSGSILQDRSFEGVFQFSWEKLENELQLRAPKFLHILSYAVTDSCRLNHKDAVFRCYIQLHVHYMPGVEK